MRTLVVAALTVLAASGPLTVIFVNTEFDRVIGFVAQYGEIEARFDDTITRERRATKITIRMKDVTLEEALDAITREAGVTYKWVDQKTVLIYQP